MTQYVYWLSDVWGWDTSPGFTRADLHREMEIGFMAMAIERMENTSPESYFESLSYEMEHKR